MICIHFYGGVIMANRNMSKEGGDYYPGYRHPTLQAMEGRRPRPVVPGSLRAECFSAGKI